MASVIDSTLPKARLVEFELDARDIALLDKRLRKLEEDAQEKALWAAVQSALSPLRTATKNAAPEGTPEQRKGSKFNILKDSFGIRRRKYSIGGGKLILGWVGLPWPDASHGWWQDRGTKRMPNPPHMGYGERAAKKAMAKAQARAARMLKRKIEQAMKRPVKA